MTIDIHLLKSNPILASIDDNTLHRFVGKAEVLRVGSNHSWLSETQNNDEIYLILEGLARFEVVLVEPGHPGDFIDLGPGELFGSMRFFGEDLPARSFVANTDRVTSVGDPFATRIR